MNVHQTYTCDVCGIPKGPANHWFLATQEVSPTHGPTFYKWHYNSEYAEFLHICSEHCATVLLSRFLSQDTQPTFEVIA